MKTPERAPHAGPPPRERLMQAAADLFYRHGIRAVGVDAIAEAAGTNKMTLYRHFPSKDDLVAEYLRQAAKGADAAMDALAQKYPDDPRAQLKAWLKELAAHLTAGNERGCALANAAIELPQKDHPVRRVIEECKLAQTKRLAALCADAGLREPEALAEELTLLIEGARVTAQSVGSAGLKERLLGMADAIITAHAPKKWA